MDTDIKTTEQVTPEVTPTVEELQAKIKELNAESAQRRIALKTVEEKLKGYEGIDIDTAREALELKALLDSKKIVKPEEQEQITKGFKEKLTTLESKLSEKDDVIRKLLVTNEFSNSDFFNGANKKTILNPDIAEGFFGKNFKIEGNKVVGYNAEGLPIMSKENPEKYAGFNEVIETLIKEYPNKDSILSAPLSGDGMKSAVRSTGNQLIQKVSDFKSSADKAKYIAENGLEAYKKLLK